VVFKQITVLSYELTVIMMVTCYFQG